MTKSILIVGGGAAASSTAVSLRRKGFDGPVTIASDEHRLPYERPPLSKQFLRGEFGETDLGMVPDDWYARNNVEVALGVRVEAIHVRERRVTTAAGTEYRYDKLVLATGGRPRRLALDAGKVSISYLRRLDDAVELRAQLGPGRRLLIVGAGFIGGEVAASARALGVEVTLIEALDLPLQRVLGPEIGQLYAEIHRENGVRLLTARSMAGLDRTAAGVAVRFDDGTQVEGDCLLVGVGMQANIELARDAGLACAGGIVVDEFCTTSAPDVYAVGDVAEHRHPLFGETLRVEHHDHALKQSAAAAATLVGERQPYDDPLWFWSDQYEHNLQVVGRLGDAERIVTRGSIESRRFIRFHLRGGRLFGAVGVNAGNDVRRAGRLIASGADVNVAALVDPGVDLRRLAARAGRG